MRIMQINLWTGRIKYPLKKFIARAGVDILCGQEAVWKEDDQEQIENLFTTADQIKNFGEFQDDFRTANMGMRLGNGVMMMGNVVMSRSKLVEKEEKLVHGVPNLEDGKMIDHAYFAQKVVIGEGVVVVNYHGYWKPEPIGDENTVVAMEKVAEMIRGETRPVVMCGDLNVISESPAMRCLDFMRDLTEESGVKTTLSGLGFQGEVACDHVLVNDKVKVRDFRVIDELVTDHKAIIVEIEA